MFVFRGGAEDDPNAQGPDNGGQAVNQAFSRQPIPLDSNPASSGSGEAKAGSEAEGNPTDTLMLQHIAFPTDLMHVLPRSAERKEYLASLFGLADELFSLRVTNVYRSATTIKVLTVFTAGFLLAVFFFLNARCCTSIQRTQVLFAPLRKD